ncbi:TniB family NTP-binding protein [Bacillus suaedaesalsae]|uniref:TniB family NTP-binding protein n=1 Tax=Bacillus suaedaesalsae TaxID=2810349 RepID=A0ABS2DFM4_9BACI|nr:TniB family NTP-binding protein [Bacillus suaedaesalsae]MBM6617289.1 TniB family NTP-binding protein [Bacillus suaedaesalsae]
MTQSKEEVKQKVMSMDDKMRKIKKLRIEHPRFVKALTLIRKCHKSLESSTDPQCMLITGPSGAGKSTLFDTYVQYYDKVIYHSSKTKKVILWGEIPSPTRINTFLEMMLDMLGDPLPTKGTIGNKKHRLENLIRDCEVELIMLDEFQHFYNQENDKINYDVADCFKSIINKTKVPVVLFGLSDAEKVVAANPQLKRRFSLRESIAPFSYDSPNEVVEFRMLLKEVDKMLPFENLSGLGEEDLADRFMFATNGVMNSVMKIIRDAAIQVVEEGREKIEREDLAKAYHLHSSILRAKKFNPFTKEEFNYSEALQEVFIDTQKR